MVGKKGVEKVVKTAEMWVQWDCRMVGKTGDKMVVKTAEMKVDEMVVNKGGETVVKMAEM